jgi:hypothetical protein
MKFKRLIAVFFAVVFVLSVPLTTFAADEKKKEIPLPSYKEHLPYYYTQFKTKEQKNTYLTIRKAIIEQKPSVTFTTTEDEDFVNDLCQLFFYNDDYTFNLESVNLTYFAINGRKSGKWKFDLTYKFGNSVYRQIVQYVDNTTEKFLATIPEDTGGFTKVLRIHDFIVESCDYDIDSKYCGTAYGALIDGKALCEGYARAFNYICFEAGISSVMSYSDPKSGEVYGHAWNKVKIGKNWYVVDATNNDNSPNYQKAGHDFLFLSDIEYTIATAIDEKSITEPKATDNTRSYYEQTGRQVKTASEAGKYIKSKVTKDATLPMTLEFEIISDKEYDKFFAGIESYVFNNVTYNGRYKIEYFWNTYSNVIYIVFQKV